LALCAGSGAVIYVLLWLFVPEQDLPLNASVNSSERPASQR
jgi:hypothetical protein